MKRNMDNSILTTLASINATILGIVFAVLVAFFIYSYQLLSQVKEQLSDLRSSTGQMMHLPTFYKVGAIDYSEYKDQNGLLDLSRIRRELSDLSPVSIPDNMKKRFSEIGIEMTKSDEETKFRATRLLDIINLLSISYPYSERSDIDKESLKLAVEPKRLEYDEQWKNDLVSLNGYLSWIWQGRRSEILTLISDYKKIHDAERRNEFDAERKKIIDDMKRAGRQMTETEAEGMLAPFRHEILFERIITDFFERVILIQNKITPQIKELSYKLNLFQQRLEIKKYLSLSLIFTLMMLIVGIFLPLFVHLYWNPPYIKTIELLFLIIIVLSYASIILAFLKKALEIKFK